MKTVAFGPLLLALSVVGISQTILAADKLPEPTLDDYLRQLGFKMVVLTKPADRPEFTVKAVLPNGKKRLFLVDTGCGRTCLDEASARGLKQIAEKPTSSESRAFGRLSDPKMVVLESLILGSVPLTNQPARLRNLEADYVRLSFDGILGDDFLLRNFCLLDCYSGRLFLRYSKPSDQQCSALAESLRRSGFAEIPMQRGYGFTIAAEANGQPVCLLVDNGCPCNMLDESQRDRLGVTMVKENVTGSSTILQQLNVGMVGLGKIGIHKAVAVKLDTLQIGPRKWNDVYLALEDLKAWGAKPGTPGEKVQGIFGFCPLVMHGAILDFVNSTLWLRPEK